MSINAYPHGWDWAWIASDSKGNIGVFTTAGEGPVPECVLRLDWASVESIEAQIGEMPIISNIKILRPKPAPSFIEFCQRGLFVFDWTDVDDPGVSIVTVYQPIVVPEQPVGIDALPVYLARVADAARLPGIDFADGLGIDIRAQLACVEAE